MVTRLTVTGPPASRSAGFSPPDGRQQHAQRGPAVNLPPIHSLNLGRDLEREREAAESPFTNRSFGTYTNPQNTVHGRPRPDIPRLPTVPALGVDNHTRHMMAYRPRLASDSFERRGSATSDSGAPSPTLVPTVIKDECSKCGTFLPTPHSECHCGNVRFTHPFQPHARHLVTTFDESFSSPLSRRGSGARGSMDSLSSGPLSRRGSACMGNVGITKSTSRRRSATSGRQTAQREQQRTNKAVREKGSRRAIGHQHKRMEIRQQCRGWTASAELNSNNRKNSGLEGKKLEILHRMLEESHEGDLRSLNQADVIQQLATMIMQSDAERTPEDMAFVAEKSKEAMEWHLFLTRALESEKAALASWQAEVEQKQAAEEAKAQSHGRYPTPLSSGGNSPTFEHFTG